MKFSTQVTSLAVMTGFHFKYWLWCMWFWSGKHFNLAGVDRFYIWNLLQCPSMIFHFSSFHYHSFKCCWKSFICFLSSCSVLRRSFFEFFFSPFVLFSSLFLPMLSLWLSLSLSFSLSTRVTFLLEIYFFSPNMWRMNCWPFYPLLLVHFTLFSFVLRCLPIHLLLSCAGYNQKSTVNQVKQRSEHFSPVTSMVKVGSLCGCSFTLPHPPFVFGRKKRVHVPSFSSFLLFKMFHFVCYSYAHFWNFILLKVFFSNCVYVSHI